MSIIDDIKRDREAGTPGPWSFEIGDYETDEGAFLSGSTMICHFGDSETYYNTCGDAPNEYDARRIARVPDMEAALLAAEELAMAADRMESELGCDDVGCMCESVRNALAAYRKATGADQ